MSNQVSTVQRNLQILPRYIYRITNLLNNKTYIGQRTPKVNPSEDVYWGSGKLLKEAIQKYGIENFKKEILQIAEITKRDLDQLEIEYIRKERLAGHAEYNISDGGTGGDLSKFIDYSSETRLQNVKIGLQNFYSNPENVKSKLEHFRATRAKHNFRRSSPKGPLKPRSTEFRKKQSEFKKAYEAKLTDEEKQLRTQKRLQTRAKRKAEGRNYATCKSHTDEDRCKMSKSIKATLARKAALYKEYKQNGGKLAYREYFKSLKDLN